MVKFYFFFLNLILLVFLDLPGGGTGNPAKNKKYFLFFILHSRIHLTQRLMDRHNKFIFNGIVVQSVRVPPCQDGSCGFEPRQSRYIGLNQFMVKHIIRKNFSFLLSTFYIFFLPLILSKSFLPRINWLIKLN